MKKWVINQHDWADKVRNGEYLKLHRQKIQLIARRAAGGRHVLEKSHHVCPNYREHLRWVDFSQIYVLKDGGRWAPKGWKEHFFHFWDGLIYSLVERNRYLCTGHCVGGRHEWTSGTVITLLIQPVTHILSSQTQWTKELRRWSRPEKAKLSGRKSRCRLTEGENKQREARKDSLEIKNHTVPEKEMIEVKCSASWAQFHRHYAI